MLLEWLPLEHFREEVCGVLSGLQVLDRDHAGAAQLPHFIELALDVTRVLGGGVAVAKVVGTLVVRLDLHGPVELVANELQQPDDMDELDRARSEGVQLRLGGGHRNTSLSTTVARNSRPGEKDHVAGRRTRRTPVGVGPSIELPRARCIGAVCHAQGHQELIPGSLTPRPSFRGRNPLNT